MQQAEEWRPVVGYEGVYSVSNLGRIRRDSRASGTREGYIRTPLRHQRGYLQVTLSRDNHINLYRVHRLVAAAFIGPCPAGKQVNHRNGIKTDNRPENLEYLTNLENAQHATRNGLRPTGEQHGSRTHPERLPRGDSHYARYAPERLARGAQVGTAHLTAAQVLAIRAAYQAGEAIQSALAVQYGVGQSTVQRIVTRASWKHLP